MSSIFLRDTLWVKYENAKSCEFNDSTLLRRSRCFRFECVTFVLARLINDATKPGKIKG